MVLKIKKTALCQHYDIAISSVTSMFTLSIETVPQYLKKNYSTLKDFSLTNKEEGIMPTMWCIKTIL